MLLFINTSPVIQMCIQGELRWMKSSLRSPPALTGSVSTVFPTERERVGHIGSQSAKGHLEEERLQTSVSTIKIQNISPLRKKIWSDHREVEWGNGSNICSGHFNDILEGCSKIGPPCLPMS